MDFHCIEALLNLPEFRVTAQVLGPVVYLYRAGNSVARKSGTIPPYHAHVRGTLPWYRTSFSTS